MTELKWITIQLGQRQPHSDRAGCRAPGGYFPLLAGVVDVAMICHVPPLRDQTCRL